MDWTTRFPNIRQTDPSGVRQTETERGRENGTHQTKEIASELQRLRETGKVRKAVANLTPSPNNDERTSNGGILEVARLPVPNVLPPFRQLPKRPGGGPYDDLPAYERISRDTVGRQTADVEPCAYRLLPTASTSPDESIRGQYGILPAFSTTVEGTPDAVDDKGTLGNSVRPSVSNMEKLKSETVILPSNNVPLDRFPVQVPVNIRQSNVVPLPNELAGVARTRDDKFTKTKLAFEFEIPKKKNQDKYEKFSLKFSLEEVGTSTRQPVAKFDFAGREVKKLPPMVVAHSLSLVCEDMKSRGITRIFFKNANKVMREALLQKENDISHAGGVISIPINQVPRVMQQVVYPPK